MAVKSSDTEGTPGREIASTRRFRAPRALVWKMLTEREHLARWWGPRGFSLTTSAMDVRPGGVWRFVMHGPDGRDYENENVYVELEPPSRLVYDHVSTPEHRCTITLAEDGGETVLSWRVSFATAEQRDRTIETFNAAVGLEQNLDRLATEASNAPGSRELVLVRTFHAPRRLVFDAWTKQEHLVRWWGPKGFTLPHSKVELRPDGAFDLCMRGPDAQDYWMRGAFREVVAPERLVFTSFIHDDQRRPIETTVTFVEHAGKTTVTMRQTIPDLEGPARGQRQGWTESLDRLEGLIVEAG